MKLVKTLTGNIKYKELIKEKRDDNIFVIKLRYASQDNDECINKCTFTYYDTNNDNNSTKGFEVYASNNECENKK
jgi:hypothetical protein